METPAPFEIRHLDETVWDVMQHDHYTPKELARLLGTEPTLVCEEVFHGRLKAKVVNHHVVSISRDDAIAWLRARAEAGARRAGTT